MLDDVRAKLPPDGGDGVGEAYEDGRRRLQELADEAEGHRPSGGG